MKGWKDAGRKGAGWRYSPPAQACTPRDDNGDERQQRGCSEHSPDWKERRAATGLEHPWGWRQSSSCQAEALGNRAASLLVIFPADPVWVKGAACDGVKEWRCCPAIEHLYTLH